MTMARTLVVTSSSDNINDPIPGMLRYFIRNAKQNDTIKFDVSSVLLKREISLLFPVVIDGGAKKVTLDGGKVDRIFSIFVGYNDKFVLKNLKFVNGKVQDKFAQGGALYILSNYGELIVDNCIFANNEMVGFRGGAVSTIGGTYTNCIFINNKVTKFNDSQNGDGGGLYATEGGLFINCVFSSNQAQYGGSVSSWGSKFYNCTFANNKATLSSSTGGIDASYGELVNCLVYGNSVNGIPSNIIVDDKTIVKNSAMESGNSLVGKNGNLGLNSSPFKGGNGADSLSLVAGVCVNAGITEGVQVLNTDILNNKRIIGSAIDLGAYEFTSTITTLILADNHDSELILFPNPSKGEVNILLPSNNYKEVSVLDNTGKVVLTQNIKANGSGTERLDLSGLQKGMYIISAKGETTLRKKVVID